MTQTALPSQTRPGSHNCICEWSIHCGGSGILICEGCGVNQCVCRCGGMMPCYGCPWCCNEDDYGGVDEEDD